MSRLRVGTRTKLVWLPQNISWEGWIFVEVEDFRIQPTNLGRNSWGSGRKLSLLTPDLAANLYPTLNQWEPQGLLCSSKKTCCRNNFSSNAKFPLLECEFSTKKEEKCWIFSYKICIEFYPQLNLMNLKISCINVSRKIEQLIFDRS